LDYRRIEESIEDRISATVQADWALHSNTKKLSAKARTKIHGLFAELEKSETDMIGEIHQALDAPTAQRMDEAVVNFYAMSRVNDPLSRQMLVRLGSDSLLRTLGATGQSVPS
jgi:hypothetical protein